MRFVNTWIAFLWTSSVLSLNSKKKKTLLQSETFSDNWISKSQSKNIWVRYLDSITCRISQPWGNVPEKIRNSNKFSVFYQYKKVTLISCSFNGCGKVHPLRGLHLVFVYKSFEKKIIQPRLCSFQCEQKNKK